jgi:cytochrome c biogenesis protein CcdA/thiol-disulfide isomerase/thioredoxin
MTLLLISFVAGLLTVLAPCVLPLLPVIVGESISGKPSRKRAIVTIASLGISLFLFTFLLKVSTVLIHVPLEALSIVSGALLIIFGLLTVFPSLWDHFGLANALNKSSNRVMGQGYMKQSLVGDIIVGAALGPVFSSCSPTYFLILATVLPVSLAAGIVYLTVYIVGLCLALFGIAVVGQRLVNKLGIASDPNGWFKRSIGILFIVIGVLVISGFDKKIEASVLAHAGIFDVTKIEQRLLTSGNSRGAINSIVLGEQLTLEQKAAKYTPAPELVKPDGYLNTDGQPITIGQFKGKKVVLIDFWTYSCINCQRTIPYLNQWYAKYKDQGLEIISVHTPEFAFEHEQANVAAALKQFGIQYPVVLDNEYQTWNAFGNQFWPRDYLIDIDGYIVHDHAGEGDYDVTEKAIQAALAERAQRLGTDPAMIATSTVSLADPLLKEVQSPETYFGYDRNQYLGNGTPGQSGTHSYTFPMATVPNLLYLQGTWNIGKEFATASADAHIKFNYSAHDVYFVASASTPVTITVLRDGVPVGSMAGSDVNANNSTVQISDQRLYRLVHDTSAGAHTIELIIHGSGLNAYTFTFG